MLDTLLHPTVPFSDQINQQVAAIEQVPHVLLDIGTAVRCGRPADRDPEHGRGFGHLWDVHIFLSKMATDIDRIWYRDYNRLQADIAAWQPPGSFEVHASALRQTYQAFLAGGHEIEGAIFVLEGTGPADSKQELIQAAGEFDTATGEFAGQLSPKAQQAWQHLQTDSVGPALRRHHPAGAHRGPQTCQPPFVGNATFAGTSMTPGIHYLNDLNKLVTSASQDLHDTALAQASAAISASSARSSSWPCWRWCASAASSWVAGR